MFVGLNLKVNRRYTQTAKNSFHLSGAALDLHTCTDDGPVTVIVTHEGIDHVICNLRKNKVEQVTLDLNFEKGEQIAFYTKGNSNVHLVGYILPSDDDYQDDSDDSLADQLLENPKKGVTGEEDDDDSDEDDSDFAVDEDEDSKLSAALENDDDDDDESDEDDDDEEEEEQETVPKRIKLEKGKQNGVAQPKDGGKKDKKNKQKQKQEQQSQQKQQNKEKPEKQQQKDKTSPKGGEKTLQGGVKVNDIQVGSGPEAKPGKQVQVLYEGRLKQNNKVFDSSKSKPFKFGLGKNEVIKGWEVGVAGMKVGGKRRITCPPHMAYGAKGHPPVIPPNSTLVFEVELKSVN